MWISRMFHRDALTFLVHQFERGRDDERYVVEKYRCFSDGEIRPVPAEQPKTKGRGRRRRTIASASAVRKMRPERNEIIVCSGVSVKGSGMQIWGVQTTGLFAARNAR